MFKMLLLFTLFYVKTAVALEVNGHQPILSLGYKDLLSACENVNHAKGGQMCTLKQRGASPQN